MCLSQVSSETAIVPLQATLWAKYPGISTSRARKCHRTTSSVLSAQSSMLAVGLARPHIAVTENPAKNVPGLPPPPWRQRPRCRNVRRHSHPSRQPSSIRNFRRAPTPYDRPGSIGRENRDKHGVKNGKWPVVPWICITRTKYFMLSCHKILPSIFAIPSPRDE